jgi:ubiquitin-conjugating enzyme E2 H
MSAAWKRRALRDVKDLQDNGFKVTGENGEEQFDLKCFVTTMRGPESSPYEKCVWRVRFTIPDGFPFLSPSVGIIGRILHPNIDEESGSICLDVLSPKAWSPSFTIRHIVETQLPYLLSYPNPSDPLNRDAAHLLVSNPEAFKKKASEHAKKNCFMQQQ